VPPRQREDLLVGGDEVGHPGDCKVPSLVSRTCSVKRARLKTGVLDLCMDQQNRPVEMMRAWPVGLMLAFAHGSIRTLAS
jgi:hypothetical protein